MEKITVCLLTYNSERLLQECIRPLLRVADEMIVVDSGSSDKTLDILSGFSIKPTLRKYTTHSDQMNYAISLSRSDWVLCMDSDEILDEVSINNMLDIKGRLADGHTAYRISRYWKVLGKPVHAMYPVTSPDFPVRLFNKRMVRFNDAPVDDKPIGFTRTEIINGHVIHDTFNSLHEVFNKLNIYTSRLCEYKDLKSSWLKILINPFVAFIKWYFVKGGWRNGRVGIVTGMYAFLYTFLKYFKAWYRAGHDAKL